MSPQEQAIRSYFGLSPIADGSVNVKDMPFDDILDRLGIPLFDAPLESGHTYEIVKIENYKQALSYFNYVGDWCIVGSEAAFNDHTGWYNTEFYFCLRDDYKDVKKAFGPEYPYDNYGMSIIAVGVLPGGELESVTSRWNWDYKGDDYLGKTQLEQLLGVKFEDTFKNRFPVIRTILHISDTHGRHRELPELPQADVIVHSGDFTKNGTEEEVFDFVNWFCDLPQFRHKVFVAGNHDAALQGCDVIEGLDANCHYLSNSSVTLDNLTFYGVPDFGQSRLDGSYPIFLQGGPIPQSRFSEDDITVRILVDRNACPWMSALLKDTYYEIHEYNSGKMLFEFKADITDAFARTLLPYADSFEIKRPRELVDKVYYLVCNSRHKLLAYRK